MSTKFFPDKEVSYADHPKFAGVRIAVLVSGKDTDKVSVCLLKIEAATEIPSHTHDTQVDSIFVASGRGEAYVNGNWRPISEGDYIFVPAGEEHGIRNTGDRILTLFVHHGPPLL